MYETLGLSTLLPCSFQYYPSLSLSRSLLATVQLATPPLCPELFWDACVVRLNILIKDMANIEVNNERIRRAF